MFLQEYESVGIVEWKILIVAVYYIMSTRERWKLTFTVKYSVTLINKYGINLCVPNDVKGLF